MTRHSPLIVAAVTVVAIAFGAGLANASPIVLNADFSLGFNGFTSGYGYLAYPSAPSPGLMYPEGMFTVGVNPAYVHDRWAVLGDHTTGDGLMMIVNGNRAPEMLVWSTTVEVSPNTTYDFSAWAASIYPLSPSNLAFSINGTLLDAPVLLPSSTGDWRRFTADWYSGNSTSAVLSLINRNTEWNGNDFALDDIALTAVEQPDPRETVPEPGSTMLLLSSGLVGLAGLVKKWNVKKAS
jgi:hypothetical protein